jgi:hypothetical protein
MIIAMHRICEQTNLAPLCPKKIPTVTRSIWFTKLRAELMQSYAINLFLLEQQ